MKAKELSGTALTFAGLAAGIFGAMQAADGHPWPLGLPLCLLALPLLVMGYRLLLLPSSMEDASGEPVKAPAKAGRVRHEASGEGAAEAAEAPPVQGG